MKKKLVLALDILVVAIIALVMLLGKNIEHTSTNVLHTPNYAAKEEKGFNLIASPEEKRVKAGETVIVTLSLSDINVGENGLNNVVGYLGYDEALFDKVDILAGGPKQLEEVNYETPWEIEINQIKNHNMYGKFCIFTMQEGVTENQDVVTLIFKLKDDLKPQTTKITFTDLKSSDGGISIEEEDRAVTLIIYEEEIVPEPETPEIQEPEPETPEIQEPEPEQPVQTGDQKTLWIIIALISTLIINILVFVKNKKIKMIASIVVALIGLIGIYFSVNAVEGNTQNLLNELAYQETWLNSEKYLVTEETVSRIAPNTNIEDLYKKFNKIVEVKNGQDILEVGKISTGMTINVKNPTKKDAEGDRSYLISVFGDINGDSNSDHVDLTSIIRNTVNKEKWNLKGVKFTSADITVDSKIDREDVLDSVKYIVYGELEIPEFKQVEKPTIEIIEAKKDEERNCYTGEVKIKITEKEENALRTQYKIQKDSEEIKSYTEIKREEKNAEGKYETEIIISGEGIYKISAYTNGKLGNRSEIPYILVNIGKDKVEYKIEYYFDGEIDNSKTEKGFAVIGQEIKDYTDYASEEYELDLTKGTNGVENLPLVVGKNVEENVIKVYYISTKGVLNIYHIVEHLDGTVEEISTENVEINYNQNFEITNLLSEENVIKVNNEVKKSDREFMNNLKYIYKEVKTDDKFEITQNGVVTGTAYRGMEDITYYYNINSFKITGETDEHATIKGIANDGLIEKVEYGNKSKKIDIELEEGYKISGIYLFKGEEIDGDYAQDCDTAHKVLPNKNKGRDTKNVSVGGFVNVVEDYHVVVITKKAEILVKVVGVPEGLENETCGRDYVILGHEYDSLEQAIDDAYEINQLRGEENKKQPVEIMILDKDTLEVTEVVENNIIRAENDVVIDLNGQLITADNVNEPALQVQNGGSLTIVDRSQEQDGKVENKENIAISIENGGELTLGENGDISQDIPSVQAPIIEGGTFGVNKEVDGEEEGIFNFYDGKIIGGVNGAIGGSQKIDDTPILYEATIKTEDGKTISTLKVLTGYEASITDSDGTLLFRTLEDAVTYVNDTDKYTIDTPVEIDIISNEAVNLEGNTENSTYSNVACLINKNVTIDLNGRAITSDDECTMFYNRSNATLKITDSTATVDETRTYSNLINVNNDYHFETINNYLQPNNMTNKNTEAVSYIEIDLTQETGEHELKLEYTGYLGQQAFDTYITTDTSYPSNIENAENLSNYMDYYNANINIGEITKTLQGGQKYYLYLKYNCKNEFDYLRIFGITIDGKDVLEEVIVPKGKVVAIDSSRIKNDGTFIIENAIIDSGSYGFVNSYYNKNTSKLILNNGIIKGAIGYSESVVNPSYIAHDIILNQGIVTDGVYMYDNTEELKPEYIEVKNDTFVGGRGLLGKTVHVYNGYITDITHFRGTSDIIQIDNGTILGNITSKESVIINNGRIKSITLSEGTVDIKDGECSFIETVSSQGDATLNIRSGKIGEIEIVGLSQDLNRIINIYDGSIEKIIANTGGHINIIGGTVETTGKAISGNGGIITIGTKITESDKNLSTTSPIIKGGTAGISGNLKINFYDGVIIAPENYTIVDAVLEDYEKQDSEGNSISVIYEKFTENDKQLEKCYLGVVTEKVARILSTTEGLELSNISNKAYELNTEDNYYYFTSVDSAIKVCGKNTNNISKIEIVKDISQLSDINIEEGKNVEIDLAGKTLETTGSVIVNGNLTISDSSAEGNGKLLCLDITNEGNLIVNSGNITREITEADIIIKNNNKLTVNGGLVCKIVNGENAIYKMTGGIVREQIENNSNVKYNEQDLTASIYVTGGYIGCYKGSLGAWVINDGINDKANGDIVFKEAADSKIYCATIGTTYNKTGNLNIDGGNYGAISTKAGNVHIQNIEMIEDKTFSQFNVNIGTNSIALIENCVIGYDRGERIINSGELVFDGKIAINYLENSGKVTINDTATFDMSFSDKNSTPKIRNNGTLTLGTKNGIVKNDAIVVETSGNVVGTLKYGAINNTGIINYYDGTYITAGENANAIINTEGGKINDCEEGYEVVFEAIEIEYDGITYPAERAQLRRIAPFIKVESSKIVNTTGINCYEEEGYYYFYNLTDVAKASKDNEETTAYVLRDMQFANSTLQEIIETNKNIVLDLNGKTLSYVSENAIENNGTLKIIDSSTQKTGTIRTVATNLITNNGNLTIENIPVVGAGEQIITNNGTLVINGGKYTDAETILNNKGIATINNNAIISVYDKYGTTMNSINNTGNLKINSATIGYVINNTEDGYVEIENLVFNGDKNNSDEIFINNNTNLENNNSGIVINGENIVIQDKIVNTNGYITIDQQESGIVEIGTVENSGTITLKNGKITSQFINNTNGNLTMEDGYINMCSAKYGNVNIENGTVNQLICGGTIKIGKEGSNILNTTPVINNVSYSTSVYGKNYFYSGIIKQVISSNVELGIPLEIPENAELVVTQEESTLIYTLTNTRTVAKIGNTEYTSLKSAVEACTGTSNYEIDLVEELFITDGREVIINEQQDITLDLNGKTLHILSTSPAITNNGKLKIIDSSTNKTGKIVYMLENYGDAIVNNNKLELNEICMEQDTDINTDNSEQVDENRRNMRKAFIYNKGDVIVNGGTYNVTLFIYTEGCGNVNIENGAEILGNSKINYYANIQFAQPDMENKSILNIINSNVSNIKALNTNINIENSEISSYIYARNDSVAVINNSQIKLLYTSELGQVEVDKSTIEAIYNIGKMKVTNSTIEGDGTLISSVVGYNSKTQGVVVYNEGDLYIEECNITSTSGRYVMYLYDGMTTIVSGSVEYKGTQTNSAAIYMGSEKSGTLHTGDLTLGKNDYSINSVSPKIIGSEYGILQQTYKIGNTVYEPLCKLYFYDGIIIGTNKKVMDTITQNIISDYHEPKVTATPKFYEVKYNETSTEAILGPEAEYAAVVKVEDVFFDDTELESAISTANSSGETIVVQSNFVLYETLKIDSSVNITLDLNGFAIEGNLENGLFENNGNLTIIDSSTSGNGYIKNYGGPAIQNNGTLNMGTPEIEVSNVKPAIISLSNGIMNSSTGIINFYSGIIKGVNNAIDDKGQVNYKDGYVSKTGEEIEAEGTEAEITFKTLYLEN